MTELAVLSPADPDPQMAALTADQRLERAMQIADRTAESLAEFGRITWCAKRCGDDMAPYRRRFGGMLELFLKIGCGQVRPEVFLKFGFRSDLYRPISKLDLADQERLATGERVPVLVYAPDGKRSVRLKDPETELSEAEVKQVFGRAPGGACRIRSEAEQASYLDQEFRKAARPVAEKVGKWRIDGERLHAKIGSYDCSLAELRDVVKALERHERAMKQRAAAN